MALTTGTNSGTQNATQSPQVSSGASGGASTQSAGVQPGTATTLLTTDKGGVSLQNKQLSIVSLGARQTSQVSQFSAPPKQHTSPLLYGVSGTLLLFAIVMITVSIFSAKNTTK